MGDKEFFTEEEVQAIQRDYPKCYNLITRLVCNSDAPEIPADIKEKTLAISDLLVKSTLIASARELYDFFDDHGVICTLEYEEGGLYYCVHNVNSNRGAQSMHVSHHEAVTTDYSSTRRKLEMKMFTRAFEIVENNLK